MTFLRLLSQEGVQNFTYTCINSAPWFNEKLQKYDTAIKFMGDNEVEITHDNPAISPNVLFDGCKVSPVSLLNFQHPHLMTFIPTLINISHPRFSSFSSFFFTSIALFLQPFSFFLFIPPQQSLERATAKLYLR